MRPDIEGIRKRADKAIDGTWEWQDIITLVRADIPDLLAYVEQLERVKEAAEAVANPWGIVKQSTEQYDTLSVEMRCIARLRKELDALVQPAEAGTGDEK